MYFIFLEPLLGDTDRGTLSLRRSRKQVNDDEVGDRVSERLTAIVECFARQSIADRRRNVGAVRTLTCKHCATTVMSYWQMG